MQPHAERIESSRSKMAGTAKQILKHVIVYTSIKCIDIELKCEVDVVKNYL